MRIVVTGASGRLGAAMVAELSYARHELLAYDLDTLDVSDRGSVEIVMERTRPDAIINCSAYNAVDAAEANAAAAFRVNAEGPSVLAAAADAQGAVFVHYGTDFVFDGESSIPYSEDDKPHPLNVYGESKLAGERAAMGAGRYYILRLASLFGGRGANGHKATVDSLAEKLLLGVPVQAQTDRTVSPSYVPDVVRATRKMLERNLPYGVYHCVSSGWTTWYGLANELALVLGTSARVLPIEAGSVSAGALRPRFCALSNEKLLAAGIAMPSWRSALRRHAHQQFGSSLQNAAMADGGH